MNRLQSYSPFDAADGAELSDNAGGQAQSLDSLKPATAVKVGRGHHHVLFTGGCFRGGVDACEEILGATDLYHDGTCYERRSARNDVVITGAAARVTWNRCPGLRWIVAGGYSDLDRSRTGPRVRDCEVIRAPFEELAVVVCINSEPFRGDVINLRIPWRWLHFRAVDAYFWLRRTFGRKHAEDETSSSSEFKSA